MALKFPSNINSVNKSKNELNSVTTANSLQVYSEFDSIIQGESLKYNVLSNLHSEDHMLRHFMYDCNVSENEGIQHYFRSGHEDSKKLKKILENINLSMDANVLEFAAGYGRMTRHLQKILGNGLFVNDIHQNAVVFLKEMGCNVFASTNVPEELQAPARFDFIFAISLFSHLPDSLFCRWLMTMRNLLKPGGFLMFTTHGEVASDKTLDLANVLDKYSGYGFLSGSEQKDLTSDIYGSMVVMPHYVIQQINAAKLRLQSFIAGEWWEYQDEWLVSFQ